MSCSRENSLDPARLKIVRAGKADIDELERIVNLAYRGGQASVAWKNENHLVQGPRVTHEDLHKHLESTESTILLLRSETGELLGCVQIEHEPGESEAHIGMLTVHPEYQNYGLGRMLLQRAGDFAKNDLACKKAKMCVFAGREELLAWYAKMGYEPTGEKMPFFGPESGLTPLVDNAHFVVVSKALV